MGPIAQAHRMEWGKMDRLRRADIAPTAKPDQVGPFIMHPEGMARLWTQGTMKDGPFPTHYEPFESPVANLVAP